MSITLTFTDDHLDHVLSYIEKYGSAIAQVDTILDLDGRRLEEIMKTHPHHLSTYDQYVRELKSIESWVEGYKKAVYAKAWKKYLEGYNRSLGTKDIQVYVEGDKAVREISDIIIVIEELRGTMEGKLDAIKQLGWHLSSISKLRAAEIKDEIM